MLVFTDFKFQNIKRENRQVNTGIFKTYENILEQKKNNTLYTTYDINNNQIKFSSFAFTENGKWFKLAVNSYFKLKVTSLLFSMKIFS